MTWRPLGKCLVIGLVFLVTPSAAHAQIRRTKSDPKAEINKMFDKLSKGKRYIDVKTAAKGFFTKLLQDLVRKRGIRNGKITREQFMTHFLKLHKKQQDAAKSGNSTKSTGNRTSKTSTDKRRLVTLKEFESKVKRLMDWHLSKDRNKDGYLDRTEASAGLKTRFDQADRNKDGRLSKAEVHADNTKYYEQRYRVKGGFPNRLDKRPVVYRAGNLPQELRGSWYEEADTDKDGQVGLYEWRKLRKKLREFDIYDRNGDGLITAEEMLYYYKYVEKSK